MAGRTRRCCGRLSSRRVAADLRSGHGSGVKNPTVGALIIRIGFWGPILKPLTIGEEVQNKAEPKEKTSLIHQACNAGCQDSLSIPAPLTRLLQGLSMNPPTIKYFPRDIMVNTVGSFGLAPPMRTSL